MSINAGKTLRKNRKSESKASKVLSGNHSSDDSQALEINPVKKKVKKQKGDKKDNQPMESFITKSEHQQSYDETNDVDLTQAKKKKRRKTDEVGGMSEIPDVWNGGDGPRKEGVEEVLKTSADRKSKRRRREEGLAEGGLPEEVRKRKRSKKDRDEHNAGEKQSDGLPDPKNDASLTDQAGKALAYAYDQFNSPSSWKFNKARQNWLIRNIWSDQAIPDTYVSLLTRYLANVQGGVREKLIRACESALLPDPVIKDVTSEVTPRHDQALSTATDMKRFRARAVLDAIPRPTGDNNEPVL